MKKLMSRLEGNKKAQIILFFIYVIATSGSLMLAQKSVVAFLLLLFSLLLLYFMSLSTKLKWLIAGAILIVLLPFSASQGPAYES